MRIAIVHYHLRRGGVTRVIENTLEGMAEAGCDVTAGVVCGEATEQCDLPRVEIAEGLNYLSEAGYLTARELANRMRQAARKALDGHDPDVWHIHNHNLGKNCLMPEVVHELAADGTGMLLHIHDFAEDGRASNYDCLRATNKPVYPLGPRIHYGLLNQRDDQILEDAGVPAAHCHLLPNAVAVTDLDEANPGAVRVDADTQVILYPTRAIRRKNVGELLLHGVVARGTNRIYASTLRPENPDAARQHDAWADLAKELNLPVRLAVVDEAHGGFLDWIARAELLITTSIAEGFGLAFLEPWLFGKAVNGRDLPEITRDFKDKGIRLQSLYPELPVRTAWVKDLEEVGQRYRQALRQAYESYRRECSEADAKRAWEEATQDGQIDFGRLDEPAQASVIRHLANDAEAREELAARLAPQAVDEEVQAHNREVLARDFNNKAYAERLVRLYQTIAEAPSEGVKDHADGDKVLDAFLSPHRFSLLRT